MNIAIVALTEGGAMIAKRLAQGLQGVSLHGDRAGMPVSYRVEGLEVFLPEKIGKKIPSAGIYTCPTSELIGKIFNRFQGIICVMAAGIVVRALAPLVQGKDRDPGVVVMDEHGQFAVSLLSGHLGGANDLARAAARVTGGTPVITTSTDVQGRLAVDVLAKDLGARLEPVEYIQAVNSAVSRGQRVTLLAEFPLDLAKTHPLWQDSCWNVSVAGSDLFSKAAVIDGVPPVLVTTKTGAGDFLYLRPPSITVGVGCRKGISGPQILEAIKEAFRLSGRSLLSIKKITSIEAKANEEGIHWAAAQLGVEVEFYSAEVLAKIIQERQGLNQSEFVKRQMGVGGVCEPASLAGSRQGKLILSKQAKQGVTVALAEEGFGL